MPRRDALASQAGVAFVPAGAEERFTSYEQLSVLVIFAPGSRSPTGKTADRPA